MADGSERIAHAVALARAVSGRLLAHRVSLVAGGLAFFVALSIAPAAIAFGAIAGLVLKPQEVSDALQALIDRSPGLAPLEGVIEPVSGIVATASGRGFGIATAVSVVIAVYASSRVVLGARLALDAAFERQATGSGFALRVTSAIVTLVAIVVAVAVIVAIVIVPRVASALSIKLPGPGTVDPVIGWIGVLLVGYVVAWAAYRFGPHAPQPRLGPWVPGAGLAAVWILAVSGGVGLYVHLSSSVSATLTVFGAPMVVLLWLYLVFFGLLVGAELAGVEERRRQSERTS